MFATFSDFATDVTLYFVLNVWVAKSKAAKKLKRPKKAAEKPAAKNAKSPKMAAKMS